MTTYTRLYNWQNDRDDGVPIKADRMDAEFDQVIAGMNTLDTSIRNFSGWVLETRGSSYTRDSATSFTIVGLIAATGVNTYYPYGRIKVVDSNGARTLYGTIISSSGSTNTQVTVSWDLGTSISLTAPITAVSYPLIPWGQPSSVNGPVTQISATKSAAQDINAATAVVTWDIEVWDNWAEFASNIFTVKVPGFYVINAALSWLIVSGAAGYVVQYIEKNTVSQVRQYWPATCFDVGAVSTTCNIMAGLPLSAGDTIRISASAEKNYRIVGNSAPPLGYPTMLTIFRVDG